MSYTLIPPVNQEVFTFHRLVSKIQMSYLKISELCLAPTREVVVLVDVVL